MPLRRADERMGNGRIARAVGGARRRVAQTRPAPYFFLLDSRKRPRALDCDPGGLKNVPLAVSVRHAVAAGG